MTTKLYEGVEDGTFPGLGGAQQLDNSRPPSTAGACLPPALPRAAITHALAPSCPDYTHLLPVGP